MTLIQSHTYTINLDNVNYVKEFTHSSDRVGSSFTMNNKKILIITCPYDKVIKQLKGAMNPMDGGTILNTVITLDY